MDNQKILEYITTIINYSVAYKCLILDLIIIIILYFINHIQHIVKYFISIILNILKIKLSIIRTFIP